MSRSARPPRSRHHVVALVVPGMSPLEISVATEFLGIEPPQLGRRWYRYTICTPEPGPVPLEGGMTLQVDHGLEAMRRADTILIPGWCERGTPAEPRGHRGASPGPSARRARWCRSAPARSRWPRLACSTGGRRPRTGMPPTISPAAIRRSTSHPDVLYVQDGDVWTSAGSAAAIDCALALVRHDFGAEVANDLARDLVVAPHRQGGQAQFVAAPLPVDRGDGSAGRVVGLGGRAPRRGPHRGRPGRARPPEPPPVQPPLPRGDRHHARTSGSSPSGSCSPDGCWRRPTCPSSGWPRTPDSARPAALRMHFQRSLRTSPQAYRRVFAQVAS